MKKEEQYPIWGVIAFVIFAIWLWFAVKPVAKSIVGAIDESVAYDKLPMSEKIRLNELEEMKKEAAFRDARIKKADEERDARIKKAAAEKEARRQQRLLKK